MSVQSLRRLFFTIKAMGLIMVSGLGYGLASHRLSAPQALQAMLILFSLSLCVGLPFYLSWWRRADEAVRTAHSTALFWGGITGTTAMVILVTFGRLFGESLIDEKLIAFGLQARAFEAGMLTTLIFISFAGTVGWGLWWWKRG